MSSESTFKLWLEFELWQDTPDFRLRDEAFNMSVTLSDGRRFAMNAWTFDFLESARRSAAEDHTNLDGEYLLAPDLLVDRLERPYLEAVVRDLDFIG